MGPFRFTKADRILRRSEFVRLATSGKKLHNPHFILMFSPGCTDRSRLGITVSKKVGKAVTRNRIKRFAREFFRKNRQELAGAWDILLIAKREAAAAASRDMRDSLKDMFNRIEGY